MRRKILWIAVCGACSSSAVIASTFTYTSLPLQVASEGGNGATQVVVSFTGKAPAPGKCVQTQNLVSYYDGAHTPASLASQGFVLTKWIQTDTGWVRMTYAKVCLGKNGQTVTGQYQVYFNYPVGYGGDFYANNLAYYVSGDLVELDLYFGGEVPQAYSNASSTQGVWVITP
jgi:hypothetical protein